MARLPSIPRKHEKSTICEVSSVSCTHCLIIKLKKGIMESSAAHQSSGVARAGDTCVRVTSIAATPAQDELVTAWSAEERASIEETAQFGKSPATRKDFEKR